MECYPDMHAIAAGLATVLLHSVVQSLYCPGPDRGFVLPLKCCQPSPCNGLERCP